jgi:hypothetical protein
MAKIQGSIPVTGFIGPTDSNDTYAVTDAIYGIDGYRSVSATTVRNSISTERRREGMLVYTQDDQNVWQLLPPPWNGTDSDWKLFISSGATSVLTASTVSGNYLPLSGGTVSGGTNFSTNLSAATIYSGSTNLYDIFITSDSNDITRVQPGTNIQTGGTVNAPIVNFVDSPSINNLTVSGQGTFNAVSATTLSASSIITNGLKLENSSYGSGKIAVSDSSGNVSFSSTTDLSIGSVTGSGTSGKLAKWSSGSVLTDSLLSESGTGVTVNGSVYIYGNVDILGTATTFNTQTVQTLDNNITLNMSGSHTSALYGGITVLSGKANGDSSVWIVDSDGVWSANTPAKFTGLRADLNGNTLSTYSSAGTGTFYVKDNGYVGVNADPTYRLHVKEDANNYFYYNGFGGDPLTVFTSTATVAGFRANRGGTILTMVAGPSSVYFDTNAYYDFYTNSTGTFAGRINSSGNWGIGQPLITAKLHVKGNGSDAGTNNQQWTNSIDLNLMTLKDSGNLGLGIDSPSEKLHIYSGTVRINDTGSTYGTGKLAVSDANGSISFSSTTILGLNLWSSSTGVNSIIANNGTENLASGYFSFAVGSKNTSSSYYSTIAGGYYNTASGSKSFIGNGSMNTASSTYSTTLNGSSNVASGAYSAVINGGLNKSTGSSSLIGNGLQNSATTNMSTVVNGRNNVVTGSYSIITNGASNNISGQKSFIGGGTGNTISNNHSSVITGIDNSVSGDFSSVVGGKSNLISGAYSSVVGGFLNSATTTLAAVINGRNNLASGIKSFIGAGQQNKTYGVYSFVGAGLSNNATGSTSTISGGRSNLASGDHSFIGGGRSNSATALFTSIAGGSGNTASSVYTFIGGGKSNTASGNGSFVVGGSGNTSSGNYSLIAGGKNNKSTSTASVVLGGSSNSASTSSYASIVGGKDNLATGVYSIVVGGNQNIASASRSFVGSGVNNKSTSVQSIVVGGNGNNSYCVRSSIINGQDNVISDSSDNATIVGGVLNSITSFGSYSIVCGGYQNNIITDHSFIGNGYQNSISGTTSSIINGGKNIVKSSGKYSFIGNGYENTASGYYSVIQNGKQNSATTTYSTILNGFGNLVSGRASSVLAGTGHTVTGKNSAIVGGGSINAKSDDMAYVPNITIVSQGKIFIATGGTNPSIILLAHQNTSGTIGTLYISSRTAGTSFVITSTNVLDTSTIGWVIIEASDD